VAYLNQQDLQQTLFSKSHKTKLALKYMRQLMYWQGKWSDLLLSFG